MTRILLVALQATLLARVPVNGQNDGARQFLVAPLEATAGTFQTIRYTFVVGDTTWTAGGGMRVEFPVAYGETEPYFWSKPQTEYPDAPGYVTAHSSGQTELAVMTGGIAGGIASAELAGGSLSPGDSLHLTYRGIVQSLAREVPIRVEVRPSADRPWTSIADSATFRIRPREAHTIITTHPADVAVGDSFSVAVVLLDRFGNLATNYRGEISLQSTDPNGSIPPAYTFTETDRGTHEFNSVRFDLPGFQRISASDAEGALQTSSHHAWVWESQPTFRRYFGDTHFHTGSGTGHHGFIGAESSGDINTLATEDFQALNSGGDHRGNFTDAATAYHYAKDVVRLDFASSSEHDAILFDSVAWETSQKISDAFYSPHRFTTFFAYEWTSGFIHHIVLYRNRGAKIFGRSEYPDLVGLWGALDHQDIPALTIPHVTWTFDEHPIWDDVNNTYRRVGEIYSLWNNRFLVQPDDIPGRFETGADNPWSYQHAWHTGHRIGLVGATDNHLGRPGANNYTIYTHHTGGFAVVLARENTREDLWNGLQNRRTYATTGTRIYLDVAVDGHPMGAEFATSAPPTISVRVGGTNMLESVEIVRYQEGAFETIYEHTPEGENAVFEFVDQDFHSDSMYYVRVTQVDEYPGRPWSHSTSEMAWSSPVWVNMD